MNGDFRTEFDDEYGLIDGLPRHLKETTSSSEKSLLELHLAK
jgi:hypothetical protein